MAEVNCIKVLVIILHLVMKEIVDINLNSSKTALTCSADQKFIALSAGS